MKTPNPGKILLLTVLMGVNLAYSDTSNPKAEAPSASALNQNITSIIKTESQKLAELKSLSKTQSDDLTDRKTVQNPDSNFQLETTKLERSLKDTQDKIRVSEETIKRLQTSSSTLAVCQKEAGPAVDAAKKIKPLIEARLKVLDKASVQKNLDKNEKRNNSIRSQSNTALLAKEETTKKFLDFVSASRIKKLSDSVFKSLESNKEILFAPGTKEFAKQMLMLRLLSNPSLLDDVDQSLKNAGRATDNTLGGHAFHPEFIKKVAANGSFPRSATTPLTTGGSINQVTPEATEYLKSTTGFSGLAGIRLKEKFSDKIQKEIDLMSSLEIDALISKKKFKSETEELAFAGFQRNAIAASLKNEIETAERLGSEIRELDVLAKAFDKKMAEEMAAISKEHTELRVKINEIETLEKLLARLSASSSACGEVEIASRKIIDDILSSEKPVNAASSSLEAEASKGHSSIKTIRSIEKTSEVQKLIETERKKKETKAKDQ